MALTKIPGHLLDKSAHIDFADNEQLRFGASQDLKIYHDGSNSYINDGGTGNLRIGGTQIDILNPDSNEFKARFLTDGAVELYHDNSKKFETTASGINVTGSVVADGVSIDDDQNLALGSSDEFKLYHTSSGNSIISETGGGSLYLDGTNIYLRNGTATGEAMADFVSDGAVTLYHNNVAKLATDAQGINVTGGIDVADITATGNVSLNSDNGTLYFGAGADMRLYHDGLNSYIDDSGTGGLKIRASEFQVLKYGTAEQMIQATEDGAVRLYHDNVQKLMTDSGGVNVTGDLAVSGNLLIAGDINSTSVTNLDVTDKTITVANNAGSSSAADGAGLIVDTGGTLPSLLWDHSNSAFQFSKALRVVDTVRIVGADTSGSSYGLIVKNSSNANTLLVQNDGVVKIDSNYLYVTNNAGIYSNGSIKARGGVQNDQGDLSLIGNVAIGSGTLTVNSNNIKIEGGANNTARELIFAHTGFTGNQTILEQRMPGGPYGRLHTTQRKLIIEAGSGGGTGTGERLEFWTNGTRAMAISTSQNVGIGTHAPSEKLEIVGTNGAIRLGGMRLSNAGSGRIGLNRNPADGAAQDASLRRFQINGPDTSGGDYLDFQSYNSSGTFQGYCVLQDGKIGIGTNAPTHKLTVFEANGSAALFRRSGSAGPVMQFQAGAAASGNIAVQSTGLGFGGGNTENKIFIDTAGSVGFGTTSPLRSLDSRHALNIFGSGGYTELMMRSRAGTAQNLGAFHWSIRGDVGGNNDDLMLLRFTGGNSPSYAGTSMQIRNDNGYVGIGTNTGQPSAPLHIVSDNEFQLKIEASASAGASQHLYTPGGYAYTVYQNGSATWRQGAYGGSNYILRNHGTSVDEFTLLSSGSLKLQTATQSETGIAQLELQNNVNANPSHVNIKFNTYAWLGLLQVEQRAAGQYGAMNFWTANNGNPTQKMCLNHLGNLCLATSAQQDGVNPKHRVIAVTGSTTVTATSWSVNPGSNGGYDVSNDDASEFDYNGAYTGAGYYNRHIAKFCLVGNYTADTWYPIVASDQLFDWVSSGSPGANPYNGFSVYFRIYTYDISAGGSEYLSHRLTDRIWVNGYTCNSNQRHHIAIGAAWGHAPNGGQSNDHQDYANNPYQMSVNHHYNTDSYYPAKQTVEFKFKTARTGLTEAHSAQSVYVYAYVG